MLDRLEPGHLYAVQYTYGKNSPFAYEESRRFMVDTGSGLDPVQIRFNLSAPESIQPGVNLNLYFGAKSKTPKGDRYRHTGPQVQAVRGRRGHGAHL